MSEKQSNKPIIISGIVIFAVIAVVLMVAFVLPVLSAKINFAKTVKGFENATVSDIMVISDPLYKVDIMSTGAAITIEGAEMKTLSEELISVVDGAKYSETRQKIMGSWDTNVILRTDGEVYTLYFTEDGFYIEKDLKQYLFSPSQDNAEAYREFYNKIEQKLSESVS